jgi:hypothetical protein
MVVEVHCIPAVDINWSHAMPWITSLPGVIFVQPHGFLKDTYVPLAVEDVDWIEVNFGNRDNYGGNIVSVYLGYHDFKEMKKRYIARIVNQPGFNRLLLGEVYPHEGDGICVVADNRVGKRWRRMLWTTVKASQTCWLNLRHHWMMLCIAVQNYANPSII